MYHRGYDNCTEVYTLYYFMALLKNTIKPLNTNPLHSVPKIEALITMGKCGRAHP